MKYPIIRTIYLYLFALVGLIMLIVGAVKLVDLGLRVFILTEADNQELFRSFPVVERLLDGTTTTTKKELAQDKEDFRKQQRQRDLASALASIIIGLPLYLYHWKTIQKDIRGKQDDKS